VGVTIERLWATLGEEMTKKRKIIEGGQLTMAYRGHRSLSMVAFGRFFHTFL